MRYVECRYCGERRNLPPQSSFLGEASPDFSAPLQVEYRTCGRHSCQYQELRDTRFNELARLQGLAQIQYFLYGKPEPEPMPPPSGLFGALLGADRRYLGHTPHARLIMPTDAQLHAELNDWQARDGWHPPAGR
jgi:hypothetical protein